MSAIGYKRTLNDSVVELVRLLTDIAEAVHGRYDTGTVVPN